MFRFDRSSRKSSATYYVPHAPSDMTISVVIASEYERTTYDVDSQDYIGTHL